MPDTVLIRLAYDEATFKESEHPRDKGGKFTSGAGGGAGGPAPLPKPDKPYKVTNHIKAVLKQAGFNPHKLKYTNKHLVMFKHPNGTQVVIHPPGEGKQFSSSWSVSGPGGEEKKGEGIQGIAKLVQQAAQKVEKQQQETSTMPAPAHEAMTNAIDKGWFKTTMSDQVAIMENAKNPNKLHINTETGDWAVIGGVTGNMMEMGASGKLKDTLAGMAYTEQPKKMTMAEAIKKVPGPAQTVLSSQGFEPDPDLSNEQYAFFNDKDDLSLQWDNANGDWTLANADGDVMNEGTGASELHIALVGEKGTPTPTPTPTPAPSTVLGQHEPPMSKFGEKGFTTTGTHPGTSIIKLSKPDGAEAEFDMETGNWLLKTPGYQTKEGQGKENLSNLLDGEKAKEVDGKWSWNNSSKSSLVGQPAAPAAPAAPKPVDPAAAAKLTKKQEQKKTLSHLISIAKAPTPSEKSAIKMYTGSGYHSMNDAMRAGNKLTPSMEEKIKHLDSYLDKNTFDQDVTLYRKISGGFANMVQKLAEASKGLPGGVIKFHDKGYQSTSTNEEVWSGSVRMVISVKKGQKGAAVDHMSSNSGEQEVLLPRNTMIAIQGINKDGSINVTLDQSHHGIIH